jgi:hypothetical protein
MLIAPLLLALSCLATPAESPVIRAGAATSNITPPLGSSINGGMADRVAVTVHDELHARCLVLDDGRSRVAIVVCDSCMIPRDTVIAAGKQIEEKTGIPPSHVLISATHSHSCPSCTGVFQSDPVPGYPEFLAKRIADGVRRAVANLAPAEVGWAKGTNDRQVFNRRWRMKPGTIGPDPFGRVNDLVRMNPPVASPDLVEPAGPVDPDVWVLAARAPDGRPIALFANYGLHYVGGVPGDQVSADYYGAFTDRVQQLLSADRLDPPFVAAMTNGTSGDVNNINFRGGQQAMPPFGQIRLVADELSQEAVKVWGSIGFQSTATLSAVTDELNLSVRKPSGDELDRAKSILAAAGDRPLTSLEQIYARETVLLDDYPETVPVTIQALRVGDLAIVGIPCEVFAEIGLTIKQESPLPATFVVSLANGYNGYLPTPAQHKLGGYETWRARSSYLEEQASEQIEQTVRKLLQSLTPEP